MLPHLAGDMSYNLMAVFELYPELSPGKGLDDVPVSSITSLLAAINIT